MEIVNSEEKLIMEIDLEEKFMYLREIEKKVHEKQTLLKDYVNIKIFNTFKTLHANRFCISISEMSEKLEKR